jgi:hypothetical protein
VHISRETLVETFRELPDDELLDRLHTGTLTDLAWEVAEQEARRRNLFTGPEETPASDQDPAGEDAVEVTSWVTVARFGLPLEAHILRTRLEAEGIPAVVADEHLVGSNPFLSTAVGGVRLQVPTELRPIAEEVIAAVRDGKYDLEAHRDRQAQPGGPGIACPRCGGERAVQERPGLWGILRALAQMPEARFRCDTCQHQWKRAKIV